MDTCFIMQPFDGGTFDKRYDDVFAPAIRKAKLEPYRVDKDPRVSIPIQDIEAGIRESKLCFADITLDNPNVWFELGFAIASSKEVVLVCSRERTTAFPFDVQHRNIIRYSNDSSSDFEKLRKEITIRISAYLSKAETLFNVAEISKVAKFDGLEPQDVMMLAILAEDVKFLKPGVPVYSLANDMESGGFTKIATNLALRNLTQKSFVQSDVRVDYDGDEYTAVFLSEPGWNWVSENKNRFTL